MKKLGYKFKAPNGESQKNVEERIRGWVYYTLIKNREADFSTGVFTHGLATKCFLRKVLDSDQSLTYRMIRDNCSIIQLKYNMSGNKKGWSFVKMNDNPHLKDIGFIPQIFK
jgi:broad specificity phosphatase PhoE